MKRIRVTQVIKNFRIPKFKEGDRVIYDGCPCVIIRKGDLSYILSPIEYNKNYQWLNDWISEELVKIDYLYIRELKLKQLGI